MSQRRRGPLCRRTRLGWEFLSRASRALSGGLTGDRCVADRSARVSYRTGVTNCSHGEFDQWVGCGSLVPHEVGGTEGAVRA